MRFAKVYKIYTENKNKELILEEVQACFKSFTVYEVNGCFENTPEASLVIEIIDTRGEWLLVKTLAASIKHLNQQTSVMWTEYTVRMEEV